MQYARVALPLAPRRLFTYEVPPDLAGRLTIGQKVVAPFGRRSLPGTLVGWEETPPAGVRLKRLEAPAETLPALPADLMALTRWAADYYLVSWGALLEAACPSLLHVRRRVSLWPGPARGEAAPGLEREVLEAIRKRPGVRPETLKRKFPVGALPRSLSSLERRGLLVRRVEWAAARRRKPAAPEPTEPGPPPRLTLTAEQERAALAIREAVDAGGFTTFLLKGVTGSGKTEVYLEGIRRALARGRQALYLVPEIGLTPLLAARLRREFGEALEVLHSGRAEAERAAAWRRIAAGRAPVVLGARSAVFAPLPRLGVIVIDEEQDPSYKQDEFPRYHARDLAIVRAQRAQVPVVLGTATPSLETFHRARQGKVRLLELRSRVDGRPLPEVEIVDMRGELGRGGDGRGPVLSGRLVEALRGTLAEGAQAILLLNRRGFASFVLCRRCGQVAQCRRCSVAMTLHRGEGKLRCHYCGRAEPAPEKCAACGADALAHGAEGTERLEEEIHRALGDEARAVRLDSDTARGGGRALGRALAAFEKGEARILLGTQMVAKGHDFPNVTLVGVLCAEEILGFPDFRAAERTYQLIHQVSGRAGRGKRPGRVLVQTFLPDHYAIRFGGLQDYEGFFEHEARYRRTLRYPPFTVLVQMLLADSSAQRGWERASKVAAKIRAAGGEEIRVLGPALAPLSRLRGRFRFQILVKGTLRRRLNSILARALEELEKERFPMQSLLVDVDPVTTL
jgi:primosomal protein N' (replication factor Y)